MSRFGSLRKVQVWTNSPAAWRVGDQACRLAHHAVALVHGAVALRSSALAVAVGVPLLARDDVGLPGADAVA
jgi:hypothetical protein